MTMPIDLVLVRHGESEGNVAVKASRKEGNDRHYTQAFRNRHSSLWRLSDKGIRDAQAAGKWLRGNMPAFDRHYTSDYLRARETAGHLGLPGAQWYREFLLRERDRGKLDVVSHTELTTRYAEDMAEWKRSALFYAPPGGESMAQVDMRIDRVLQTLHRECTDKRVIVVAHGEVMWTFRLRLERMPLERYLEIEASDDLAHRIFNGQIIHYTRRDPNTGALAPYLNWMRMIRADDASFDRGWQQVIRPKFSNEELLAGVDRVPRLIND